MCYVPKFRLSYAVPISLTFFLGNNSDFLLIYVIYTNKQTKKPPNTKLYVYSLNDFEFAIDFILVSASYNYT